MSDTVSRSPLLAVECAGVVKRFYHYEHRTTSVQELVGRALRLRKPHDRHERFVLRALHLRIERGDAVAFVGPNGSGKSTALRLIAGVYPPSEGTVITRGRVIPVIELGAGFHPELTGAENVVLYGAMLGLDRHEIDKYYPEIVAFSELADSMEMPMKYFSSGMRSRLAFSTAMCASPDILLLDEVLAVGDEYFRGKCVARQREYHASGGTLVVVSHDLEAVRELCARAVWFDGGQVRQQGDVNAVIDAYLGSAA